MKRSEQFIYRCIADEHMLIPVGTAAGSTNGLIVLNEQGAFLWNALPQAQTEGDLAAKLLEEYDVSLETAAQDVEEFLAHLRKLGALE